MMAAHGRRMGLWAQSRSPGDAGLDVMKRDPMRSIALLSMLPKNGSRRWAPTALCPVMRASVLEARCQGHLALQLLCIASKSC